MSEHIVALALAAAKRLFVEHEQMGRGQFNQHGGNKMLRGGVCGIFGFGNVGTATARLMRAFGMRIHAINRRGASEEPTDWVATPNKLDELLRVSDVFVITAALTTETVGRIGSRELGLMKEDAIFINVARAEIVDEAPLYPHLKAHPRFFAGIDAWWVEPVRHGRFEMGHPFLDLPNVIGSPTHTGGRGGMAASKGVTRFSTCRTSSARRTIRRAAGLGGTNTCAAPSPTVAARCLARRRGTW